jgi:hypothetical protein
MAARGEDLMREVVFSACESYEVAYESNGQGDFTRNAVAILQRGIQGLNHDAFIQQVKDAFGQAPRQHPILDCAPSRLGAAILQPLDAPVSAPVSAPILDPISIPATGNGNRPSSNGDALKENLEELLQTLLNGLRNG